MPNFLKTLQSTNFEKGDNKPLKNTNLSLEK